MKNKMNKPQKYNDPLIGTFYDDDGNPVYQVHADDYLDLKKLYNKTVLTFKELENNLRQKIKELDDKNTKLLDDLGDVAIVAHKYFPKCKNSEELDTNIQKLKTQITELSNNCIKHGEYIHQLEQKNKELQIKLNK